MNKVVPAEILAQSQQTGPGSEATRIEQSRAIEQVRGALIVARQNPRDEIEAGQRMRAACDVLSLAERAFFRFPRGGQQISGASIHLATELARCWGNIEVGVVELKRDDEAGVSEMQAFAWDLETNYRHGIGFIVPHRRDKRGGAEALTDMRDIYENNANNGARRLRECIFRVLPTSFVDEAKSLCHETIKRGDGTPIEQRREQMLEAFNKVGVTRKQIEIKVGRAADRLTEYDIATLRVIYSSLRRGEIRVADEFKVDATNDTAEEIQKQAAKQKGAAKKQAAPIDVTDDAPEEPGALELAAGIDAQIAAATTDTIETISDEVTAAANRLREEGFGEQANMLEGRYEQRRQALTGEDDDMPVLAL